MASQPRRAVRDQRADERRGARFDRQSDAMARDALGGDALANGPAIDMGHARRAPVRLVEMDMAFDESGKQQFARKIEGLPVRAARARTR